MPITYSGMLCKVNGIATTRLEPPSESSSSEEQEHAAEERRLLCEQLSKMPVPKVRLLTPANSTVTLHSARNILYSHSYLPTHFCMITLYVCEALR